MYTVYTMYTDSTLDNQAAGQVKLSLNHRLISLLSFRVLSIDVLTKISVTRYSYLDLSFRPKALSLSFLTV